VYHPSSSAGFSPSLQRYQHRSSEAGTTTPFFRPTTIEKIDPIFLVNTSSLKIFLSKNLSLNHFFRLKKSVFKNLWFGFFGWNNYYFYFENKTKPGAITLFCSAFILKILAKKLLI